MERRKEAIIVPFILAGIVLLIFGYRTISGQIVPAEILGLLTGLFCGQIGIYIYGMASLNSKYTKLSRRYYLFAIFGVVFVTAYFSKYFSYGYFGGFGLIVCFGHSFYAMLEKKHPTKKTKEK